MKTQILFLKSFLVSLFLIFIQHDIFAKKYCFEINNYTNYDLSIDFIQVPSKEFLQNENQRRILASISVKKSEQRKPVYFSTKSKDIVYMIGRFPDGSSAIVNKIIISQVKGANLFGKCNPIPYDININHIQKLKTNKDSYEEMKKKFQPDTSIISCPKNLFDNPEDIFKTYLGALAIVYYDTSNKKYEIVDYISSHELQNSEFPKFKKGQTSYKYSFTTDFINSTNFTLPSILKGNYTYQQGYTYNIYYKVEGLGPIQWTGPPGISIENSFKDNLSIERKKSFFLNLYNDSLKNRFKVFVIDRGYGFESIYYKVDELFKNDFKGSLDNPIYFTTSGTISKTQTESYDEILPGTLLYINYTSDRDKTVYFKDEAKKFFSDPVNKLLVSTTREILNDTIFQYKSQKVELGNEISADETRVVTYKNGKKLDLSIDIISEEYRWKLGSEDEIVKGDKPKDINQFFSEINKNFKNLDGIICVGMASEEGIPNRENPRALSRAETMVNRINESNDTLPIVLLNLGQYKIKNSDMYSNDQRRVMILKINKSDYYLRDPQLYSQIEEILKSLAAQMPPYPIDVSKYSLFNFSYGRNIK